MNIENVIKSLSTLVSDTELHHEENWDDSQEVTEWREDAIISIESIISFLSSEKYSVGTLTLNGEVFILKTDSSKTNLPSFDFKKTRHIFKTLIDDIGLEDKDQWLEKGFTPEWRTNNINAIHFVNHYLASFSGDFVGHIDLHDDKFLIFKTKPL